MKPFSLKAWDKKEAAVGGNKTGRRGRRPLHVYLGPSLTLIVVLLPFFYDLFVLGHEK
jgi:hypothetical protein